MFIESGTRGIGKLSAAEVSFVEFSGTENHATVLDSFANLQHLVGVQKALQAVSSRLRDRWSKSLFQQLIS